jgi:hypothetical protein
LTIPKVKVDVIVADVLKAMDSQQFLVVPGLLARLTSIGLRHFPRISRLVGDTQIRKNYIGPQAL